MIDDLTARAEQRVVDLIEQARTHPNEGMIAVPGRLVGSLASALDHYLQRAQEQAQQIATLTQARDDLPVWYPCVECGANHNVPHCPFPPTREAPPADDAVGQPPSDTGGPRASTSSCSVGGFNAALTGETPEPQP